MTTELEAELWKAREQGLKAIQALADEHRFRGEIFVAAFLESVVKLYTPLAPSTDKQGE